MIPCRDWCRGGNKQGQYYRDLPSGPANLGTAGSIPDRGAKSLEATKCGQKQERRRYTTRIVLKNHPTETGGEMNTSPPGDEI